MRIHFLLSVDTYFLNQEFLHIIGKLWLAA